MKTWIAALALALALSGCALMNKGDAINTRWFTPDPFAGEGPHAVKGCGAVRLGRVDASAHLRERIVWRGAGGELGFYDDRRWTDKPEAYLRRALVHALFEELGLRQVMDGDAPTLDVDLVEFEEVRDAPPRVRLRATAVLHDFHVVHWQDTVTVERPLSADAPTTGAVAVVKGLTEALRDSVRVIATRTAAEAVRLPNGLAENCGPTSSAVTPRVAAEP